MSGIVGTVIGSVEGACVSVAAVVCVLFSFLQAHRLAMMMSTRVKTMILFMIFSFPMVV